MCGINQCKLSNIHFTILGIEELRSKREALKKQILQEEEEKHKIENDPHTPTDELSHVNESLASKIAAKKDYDKTIAETETAYKKVTKRFIDLFKIRLSTVAYPEGSSSAPCAA